MTTYYVDSNQTFAATFANNGTASVTPWGGIGGIQRALSTMASADTVLVKQHASGTALIGKYLVKFTTNGNATGAAISIGDAITVSGTGSPAGYVCFIAPNPVNAGAAPTGTTIYAEMTGYTTISATGTITDATTGATITYSARTFPGVSYVTSGATNAGRTRLIGVNASWADDGLPATRVLIDASLCLTGVYSPVSVIELRNFEVANTGTPCSSYAISTINDYNLVVNCKASLGGTYGIVVRDYSTISRCESYSNGSHGLSIRTNSQIIDSVSIGNTQSGLVIASESIAERCIFHGNLNGVEVGINGGKINNCTIDGNTQHGINMTAGASPPIIMRCRITNNGTGNAAYYGVYTTGITLAVSNYNVYGGNGTGADHDRVSYVSAGAADVHASTDAEIGYVDSDNHNFALTTAALMRREALTIGATTSYLASGATPDDEMTSATGVLKTDITPQAAYIFQGTTFGAYNPGGTYDQAADRAAAAAAQLVTDKAAVTAAVASILQGTTILTIPGTFDLAADRAAQSAAAAAAQLVTDKAAVTLAAASILTGTTILTIPGTFDRLAWEAGRNTDPGLANVKLATAYKIAGVTYTGTFSVELPEPDPSQSTASALARRILAAGVSRDMTERVLVRPRSGSAYQRDAFVERKRVDGAGSTPLYAITIQFLNDAALGVPAAPSLVGDGVDVAPFAGAVARTHTIREIDADGTDTDWTSVRMM